MGVLPLFPNFLPFLSFYSTLRQYRVTLSCWESGLLSSPISLFHFQSKSGTLPFPLKGYGPTALILTQDSLPSLHGRLANYSHEAIEHLYEHLRISHRNKEIVMAITRTPPPSLSLGCTTNFMILSQPKEGISLSFQRVSMSQYAS